MGRTVVTEAEKLIFTEGRLLVKTLETEDELRRAYALRHHVFAERLRWVPETGDRLESDAYDAWSTMIGAFSEWGQLLGIVRMTQAPVPFMLESEFSACVVGDHRIRKELDTAEITRLAVNPALTDRALSTAVMRTIIKGSYQWCLAHEVRYTYLVVEHRLFRALRMMGWPCRQIGKPIALPPAHVLSVAALIDLDEFRSVGAVERPEVVEWFTRIESGPTGSASPPSRCRAFSAGSRNLEGTQRDGQTHMQWEREAARLLG